VIRAVPAVVASVPNVKFLIVGGGWELEELSALAAELGVSDNVVFTGKVEPEAMAPLLKASDVYVSSSLSDAGIASSTAEAMLCGLPIVHSDNSDNSWWAKNGAGGYMFANKDHAELARGVLAFLGDAEARAEAGGRNIDFILEHNLYQTEMSKMESLYQELAISDSQ
jgi:glycosyltransferase involved in cell wall biosynthesis